MAQNRRSEAPHHAKATENTHDIDWRTKPVSSAFRLHAVLRINPFVDLRHKRWLERSKPTSPDN